MGTENGLKYKNQEVKSILIEKFYLKNLQNFRTFRTNNAIWDSFGPFNDFAKF